jgi:hypothetical protein
MLPDRAFGTVLVRPMKLLALGRVVPRGAAVPRRRLGRVPHQPDWAGWSDGRSFRLSFHPALLGPTGAHWLDDPPDLSCKESTRQYSADGPRLSCNSRRGGWVGS